jgi:acetyltransferase-like isoleucine patch superfamily enzyme
MDHGIFANKPIREQDNTVSPVKIGRDCWIGANATILKGSCIEDGAIIGAKSLVKGRVKQNSIVVGNPAREIKCRKLNDS